MNELYLVEGRSFENYSWRCSVFLAWDNTARLVSVLCWWCICCDSGSGSSVQLGYQWHRRTNRCIVERNMNLLIYTRSTKALQVMEVCWESLVLFSTLCEGRHPTWDRLILAACLSQHKVLSLEDCSSCKMRESLIFVDLIQ